MLTLSFSAAQKFLLSPFSYYAHYFLRLRPEKQGSALIFGSALDVGLNSLLEDKRDGKPIDLEKAKTEFNRAIGATKSQDVKYSKADVDYSLFTTEELTCDWNEDEFKLESLRRKGMVLLEEYVVQVLPQILEVYKVQHSIFLKNEAGEAFTGVIDFICKWSDNRIYICDNKSSSIKYALDSVENSKQLATYYEAMREEYKLDGALFVVIQKVLRKRKLPKAQIDIVIGQIPEELINTTFREYEQVLTGIKSGNTHCTRREKNGCCSAPWGCVYKTFCESEGKDLTGLKYEEKKK